MKLLNLCEESQNYLTDPQEIENYIRKVLLFTKGYTIDQNGHVTFRAQLDISKKVQAKRLNIKIAKCGVLVCKNSNLESLDNVPDICKNYTIINNNILDFRGIDKFNISNMYTKGNKLESFRGIENALLHMLRIKDLDYLKNCNNIINILFTICDTIFVSGDTYETNELLKIIKEYLRLSLKSRKEYVMDCAVELIDNGFEEAAEL